MKLASRCAALAFAILAGGHPFAQKAPAGAPPAKVAWEISATVDGYIRPDQDSYVDPILSADHGWLHLEGRYNYENLRTGSLWIGYNFSTGKKWVFHITPMIGGVFGRSTGIAPGLETSLSYKGITLSLLNEYVFDTNKKAGNFYYSEPQLTYAVTDWFRVGLAAQRTKAFQTKLDVQRGFLVGFTHKRAEFTTYVYDLGFAAPTVVLELGYSF